MPYRAETLKLFCCKCQSPTSLRCRRCERPLCDVHSSTFIFSEPVAECLSATKCERPRQKPPKRRPPQRRKLRIFGLLVEPYTC